MSQPSPYYSELVQPSQKNSNKVWMWVGLGCGGLLLVCVIACCGIGGMTVKFGASVAAAQARKQVENDPDFVQRVGTIQSFDMNIVETGAEDGENTFVYDVKGTLGEGKLVADEDGDDVILSARLILSTGETVQIIP